MSLDKDQVRKYIIDAAKAMKIAMKEDLKGKLVYLKFDAATRIRQNYLGLNVRYMFNEQSITKTLAVVDTLCEHKGRFIKVMIQKVLDEYEIPLKNVIMCVTDNAKNMIGTVQQINRDIQAEGGSRDVDVDDDEDDEDEDNEDDDVEPSDLDLEAACPPCCEHMRCAAHTLQLAVGDGLKHKSIKGIVAKLRNVAKEARNPNIEKILKKTAKKVALIDMETRWGSTYLMIDRLVEMRPFLEDMADVGNCNLKLTKAEWDQAVNLRDLLKKAFIMTKSLQFEDCSPGYFYKKWTGLKLHYAQHGSKLAEVISDSMGWREAELLGPGILLGAVVVDVNNMGALSDNPGHEEKGREAVVQMVYRLEGLVEVDEVEDVEVEPLNSSVLDSDPEMAKARKRHRSGEAAARAAGKADLDNSLEDDVLPDPEAHHEDEERVMLTPPPTER